MYPVIFKIGRFELHSYGVMLALAFTLGVYDVIKRGKRAGFTFDQVYNAAILVIITALVGSRLTYVAFHLEEFQGRWLDIINPIQSTGVIGLAGMVILGGVVATSISAIIYLRLKNIPAGKMFDVFAPSLALGIAIGRIGCFLNGCCFGTECGLPWGMAFPEGSYAHYVYGYAHIHPTQLYEFLYCLLIFFILLRTERIKKFQGFNFALFLTLYGFFRILNESVRYYDGAEAGMVVMRLLDIRLTISQITCIFLIIIGLIIIFTGKRSANLDQES